MRLISSLVLWVFGAHVARAETRRERRRDRRRQRHHHALVRAV